MVYPSIVLLIGISASCWFLYYGIIAKTAIQKMNPCKMTYTYRTKSIIKIKKNNSNYKLWKISNPSNEKINPQPVLFLPGHLGR